jgi:hypothetical protein
MVVQPTPEPADLAAAAEFDKERQTIEKSLSKLSSPIVRIFCLFFLIHIFFFNRFKILKVEVL